MVLQDSSEVAFPENDSHSEDLLFDKELSSSKNLADFWEYWFRGAKKKLVCYRGSWGRGLVGESLKEEEEEIDIHFTFQKGT